MKKFSGKVFAGVFAAAVMASAAFASVSAAGYASNPGWDAPKTDDVTADDLKADIEKAKADKATTLTVNVESDGASLTKSAVEAVKASGLALEVKTEEGTTIAISAEELKKVNSSIDLGMGVDSAKAEVKLDKVTVPANSVMIQPAAKGEFGFSVKVTVKAPEGVTKDNAKLFYVDGDKVTEVKDKDAITVDANGNATITINHASYYVITSGTVKAEADGKENNNKEDNVNTGVTLPIALVALAGGSVAVSAIAAKKRK